MILELIFEILTGRAMRRAQVLHISHIVEYFLRVYGQFTQVV